MSSSRRLLLGVPVLLAGALVGLCLSAPEGPVAERPGAVAAGITSARRQASAPARRDEEARGQVGASAGDDEARHSRPSASEPLPPPPSEEGRDVCCGAGHDDGDGSRAHALGVLLGRVLDPTGCPLASARVEARSVDGASCGVGQSGPDGCFRLEVAAAGELVVVARCTGWLDGRSLPVRLRAGDTAHVGDLRLSEGFTLAGRVVDSGGRTVEGARVALVDGEGERHVVSEADGRFEVAGLAAGETTLVASAPGALPSEPLRCPVGADLRDLELRLRGAPRLRGRVLGPDGLPVAGARVARFGDLDAAITTGADGAFELEGEREGEPLLVTAPGLAAARVTAAPAGAACDLEVRLVAVAPAPGTTARLALRRGDAPAAGVTLLVVPAGARDLDGDGSRVEVVTSDVAGRVWLAPGALDLALVDASTAHARLETRSLSAAEVEARWELQRAPTALRALPERPISTPRR